MTGAAFYWRQVHDTVASRFRAFVALFARYSTDFWMCHIPLLPNSKLRVFVCLVTVLTISEEINSPSFHVRERRPGLSLRCRDGRYVSRRALQTGGSLSQSHLGLLGHACDLVMFVLLDLLLLEGLVRVGHDGLEGVRVHRVLDAVQE